MFSYSVLTLLLLYESQLYSAVSWEIQVSLGNHCRSRSVTIMLHAQSLTSVPVCRCSALLKAAGLYRFTHYFWSNCHTALLIYLKKNKKKLLSIFVREIDDIKMEKCRSIGTSFRVLSLIAACHDCHYQRRSDKRHFNALFCFGNHLVLGSDSETTPFGLQQCKLMFSSLNKQSWNLV